MEKTGYVRMQFAPLNTCKEIMLTECKDHLHNLTIYIEVEWSVLRSLLAFTCRAVVSSMMFILNLSQDSENDLMGIMLLFKSLHNRKSSKDQGSFLLTIGYKL